MLRLKYRIFGRENELNALVQYVQLGKKVLIKGRRGIGKTFLVKNLMHILKDDIRSLYLNCERVTTPRVLLSEIGVEASSLSGPDEVLNAFFKTLKDQGIDLLIMDEFVYLVRDFSKRKPYRNIERVVAHLRSLILDFDGAVILTTSTLWKLYRMIRDYERRLARTFDVVMKLDPLKIEDAAKIAELIVGGGDESLSIAELGDGVPFYTEAIALTRLRCSNVYEAFLEELNRGALNELFRALFSDMPAPAREVIYLLSKGPRVYESLEKEVLDDALPYSLEYLVEMDIVGKIQRRRRTTYYIKDKVFGAWVSVNRIPELARNIHKITRLLAIGFESIVRELFLSIVSEIEIPTLGKHLVFGPVETIRRVEMDGEIDLLAIDKRNRTIIGEITIRDDPGRKISQLIRSSRKIVDMYKIEQPFLLLITYNQPSNEIIEHASENNILIMTNKHLNQLARKINYRPI